MSRKLRKKAINFPMYMIPSLASTSSQWCQLELLHSGFVVSVVSSTLLADSIHQSSPPMTHSRSFTAPKHFFTLICFSSQNFLLPYHNHHRFHPIGPANSRHAPISLLNINLIIFHKHNGGYFILDFYIILPFLASNSLPLFRNLRITLSYKHTFMLFSIRF